MKKDSIALIVLLAAALLGFAPIIQQPVWSVPDAAAKVKNPVKNTTENVNLGKSLYAKDCKSCHGKDGLGDGPKAAELKNFPGDLTTADFQSQTDGALFYKISEGKDEMPSFKKKVDDPEDIWTIVVYLRTLKK